jgi:protein-disulfide isomerase
VEESKKSRQEGSQEAPEPSGMETAGPESSQEPAASSELPAAEEPGTGRGPEAEPGEVEPSSPVGPVLEGRRNPLPIAIAAAVVAFAAVGIFVLGMFTHAMVASDDDEEGQPAAVVQPGAAPEPTVGPVDVSVDDDPAKGPEDAPVTIIEFSDFQCAYCARFYAETLPQILENYGDRVRFVYRDFPLTSIHAHALKAAEAAECADDQGSFWEYHDLLFQNQSALDLDSLKGYAASLNLDTAAFNECLDSGKYTDEVRNDVQDGLAAGVQGTPAFFINGRLLAGAQPYPVFEGAIEAALAEAGE